MKRSWLFVSTGAFESDVSRHSCLRFFFHGAFTITRRTSRKSCLIRIPPFFCPSFITSSLVASLRYTLGPRGCVLLFHFLLYVLEHWVECWWNLSKCFVALNTGTRYDSSHQTADDYTLMLEGVPPEVTSERRLHRYLEKELNMEGRIYGVCSLSILASTFVGCKQPNVSKSKTLGSSKVLIWNASAFPWRIWGWYLLWHVFFHSHPIGVPFFWFPMLSSWPWHLRYYVWFGPFGWGDQWKTRGDAGAYHRVRWYQEWMGISSSNEVEKMKKQETKDMDMQHMRDSIMKGQLDLDIWPTRWFGSKGKTGWASWWTNSA